MTYTRVKQRSNPEWLSELRADGTPEQAAAIEDLRQYLLRAVLYFFSVNPGDLRGLARPEIEQIAQDLAQDALLTILKNLDDFRGESKFTTWAYRFAINMSLVEARRQRWKNISLDRILENSEMPDFQFQDKDSPDPDRAAQQQEIWNQVREVIETELTARQRAILTAVVFDDVPVDLITREFKMNRNAVYKMVHDARVKLKKRLEERGFAVDEILNLFGSAPAPRLA
ncbi:MAG: DNA-directed RNA polymerase sigma-70 factor [Chloroflexota bacterium]|nr:MAG: DNA-directed RNA polymerase sigma-70 factor [Chloroflexota bacterium]